MANELSFTVADFYERSDGRVLLLRIASSESILQLQELFTRLARAPGLRNGSE